MTRIRRFAGSILAGALVLAGTAQAEPLTRPQPAPSEDRGSPSIEVLYDVGSEIRYDTDLSGYGTIAFDVKRKTVLARLSYGDFSLSGGVTHDARIEPGSPRSYPVPMAESPVYGYPRSGEPEDPVGKGFVASAGVRSRIWEQNRLSLRAEGRLSYSRDSYDAKATYVSYGGGAGVPPTTPPRPDPMPLPEPVPVPTEVTETYEIIVHGAELSAGLVGAFTGKRSTVYAGMELLAYSNMAADTTVTSPDGSRNSDRSDMERSDPVTVMLGIRAAFKGAWLLLETRAFGERSLRFGVGVGF